MGITLIMSLCCHKYRQTFLCFIILFASSSFFFSSHFVFTAEGRSISNFNKVAQKELKEGESMMVAKSRSQIGSRPPKCEGRCRNCGHCEAVQVPIVPQLIHSSTRETVAVTTSRGDDLSNYKPMSWKCKCGDYFFNP